MHNTYADMDDGPEAPLELDHVRDGNGVGSALELAVSFDVWPQDGCHDIKMDFRAACFHIFGLVVHYEDVHERVAVHLSDCNREKGSLVSVAWVEPWYPFWSSSG